VRVEDVTDLVCDHAVPAVAQVVELVDGGQADHDRAVHHEGRMMAWVLRDEYGERVGDTQTEEGACGQPLAKTRAPLVQRTAEEAEFEVRLRHDGDGAFLFRRWRQGECLRIAGQRDRTAQHGEAARTGYRRRLYPAPLLADPAKQAAGHEAFPEQVRLLVLGEGCATTTNPAGKGFRDERDLVEPGDGAGADVVDDLRWRYAEFLILEADDGGGRLRAVVTVRSVSG
jgi:hypothetical protein